MRDAVVRELNAAQAARTTIESVAARHPGFSDQDAYAIAAQLAAAREARGDPVVGRKIGFTNPAGWAALRAKGPFWGFVHRSTLIEAPSGAVEVSIADAVAAKLEPEIGFGLRQAPDPARTSPEDLLRCIEWVAPCFELVDCHYANWKFVASEAIADFGVHFRLVVGPRLAIGEGDIPALVGALGDCEAFLEKDGELNERGKGSNTLGHPLKALAALVEILAGDRSMRPLKAGEVITTGTLAGLKPVTAGERWRFRLDGIPLDPLEVRLTG